MDKNDSKCFFFLIKNYLSVVNDCLFWYHRLIIPPGKVISLLHESHSGVTKMKGLAGV